MAKARARPVLPRLALLALPVAALALPSVAAAHSLGLSQGRYRVIADAVVVTLTFARDDLRLLIHELDADRDGRLSEVEVMMGSTVIGTTITAGLALSLDDRACTANFEGARLREEDGLEITLRYRCASPSEPMTPPSELRIDFSALAEFRGVHHHIARVVPPREEMRQVEKILDRLRPSALISLQEFARSPQSEHTDLSLNTTEDSKSDPFERARAATDLIDKPAIRVAPAGAAASADLELPPVDREYSAYLRLGIEHILSGLDHLVFLLGLTIVGGKARSWALMITAFTVGHSLSLALATLEIYTPNSAIIEPLIAASIIYIGAENLLGTGQRPYRRRWRLTLPFGFVHGFGFAGALLEIGLPPGQEALVLALFNLGVEIGQLLALVALAGLLALMPGLREPLWSRRISAMIIAAGLFWLFARVFT